MNVLYPLKLIPAVIFLDLYNQIETDIANLEIEIERLERQTLLELDMVEMVLKFETEESKRMELDEKRRLFDELKKVLSYEKNNYNKVDSEIFN